MLLFALALAVWGCALAGWVIDPRSMLLVITGSWVLAGVAALGWTKWRLERTAREIAGCEVLLKSFEQAVADAPAHAHNL